ncbi:hypothetical protein ACFL4H_00105 [Candidatus Neomarinimicrobiota bacterium]
MRYILIPLFIMGCLFGQETKIDSVTIQAKMAEQVAAYNTIVKEIARLEELKEKVIYSHRVLATMLIPKVEEEDDKTNDESKKP